MARRVTFFGIPLLFLAWSLILSSGLPAAEIASQLAELDANMGLYLDANFNSFLMFATVFLIGAVVALASAAILRRS